MQRAAPECACASSKVLEQAPALKQSEQHDFQEASMATQVPEADQVFNAGRSDKYLHSLGLSIWTQTVKQGAQTPLLHSIGLFGAKQSCQVLLQKTCMQSVYNCQAMHNMDLLALFSPLSEHCALTCRPACQHTTVLCSISYLLHWHAF